MSGWFYFGKRLSEMFGFEPFLYEFVPVRAELKLIAFCSKIT